jgi:signal peptidase I
MTNVKSQVLETVRFFLTVFVLWLIIRVFIVQPFLVDGASMSPNFETNDYLIINKFEYFFSDPERGDVVVFKYPEDPKKYFIKRIVGLPGETVTVRDGVTTVQKVDGTIVTINESFVTFTQNSDAKVQVLGEKQYFVMGDNRSHSYDSRAWGPLDEKYIAGTALVRLYPFKKIDAFPASIESFGLSTLETNQ